MILTCISLIAVAVALAVSPGSLVLLGNQVGVSGGNFPYTVLLAAVVYCLTAFAYGKVYGLFPGPAGEARLFTAALGPVSAVALPLSSRLVFAVAGATALLATAGYVFNEVFLRWFPNLGFSFLLLVFLTMINFAGAKVWALFQLLFVITALAGLSVLTAAGLILSGDLLVYSEQSTELFRWPNIVWTGFLLFVGFDLVLFVAREADVSGRITRPMIIGILLSASMLSLWGLVSLAYVTPERLAESTIPHTLAARAILGEAGRWCMGAVAIGGVCAAVNPMFRGVSRMLSGMAGVGLLPRIVGFGGDRGGVPLLIVALTTASMMGVGMAGEPVLEVYVAGGLWLWLLNYAVIHVSLLIVHGRRPTQSPDFFSNAGYWWASVIGAATLSIILVGLLWSGAQIQFVAWALGAGLLVGFFCSRMLRKERELLSEMGS